MFHAYEVIGEGPNDKVRRNDLPDFKEPDEIGFYLTNNHQVNQRNGKFVRLNWEECDSPLCTTCNKVN